MSTPHCIAFFVIPILVLAKRLCYNVVNLRHVLLPSMCRDWIIGVEVGDGGGDVLHHLRDLCMIWESSGHCPQIPGIFSWREIPDSFVVVAIRRSLNYNSVSLWVGAETNTAWCNPWKPFSPRRVWDTLLVTAE